MNGKIKKMIWSLLLLLLVCFGAVGYYLFNKGPVDVKNSSGKKVDAVELYKAFSTDSVTAQKKYSDQILEVKGQVNSVTVNRDNNQVVTIQTNTEAAFINCTLEENDQWFRPGETVSIKGICSGIGQGEPDLGIKGDVYLSRCFLVK